jgi:hypothetical protein
MQDTAASPDKSVVGYFDSRRLKLCHSEPSPSDSEEPASYVLAPRSQSNHRQKTLYRNFTPP